MLSTVRNGDECFLQFAMVISAFFYYGHGDGCFLRDGDEYLSPWR